MFVHATVDVANFWAEKAALNAKRGRTKRVLDQESAAELSVRMLVVCGLHEASLRKVYVEVDRSVQHNQSKNSVSDYL